MSLSTTIRQAGAVAFRDRRGKREYLVVQALRNPAHWIFPKGHIEPGERADAAALRELEEEAGVVGDLVGPIGTSVYDFGDGRMSVKYFLVAATGDGQADEKRARRWLAPARARATLSFENARRLIDAAERRLNSGAPSG